MNKTFHSVWNASKQAYVAAAETVSAKGKPTSGVKVAAVMAGLMGSLLGNVANAQTAPPPASLPTSGQVSAGQASISQNGAHMVINQSTQRAAINWQTFNVGKDAHVQFQQPSAASVTLNRVMSSDPSQIFGRISGNGQVVLTNPAGVYFGKDARVDVGGLVATTHGISDADFMAGKSRFERNGSTGSVINEGELKAALGGYIALLAPEVRNQGAVIAHMGTVALASGEAIDLKFDSNNRLTSLRVEPSQIAALVENKHAVQAPGGLVIISAQSMDRLVGGVVKNSGRIEANGLQQQGGRIVLSASHKVDNTGGISANATADATAAGSGPAGKIEISAPEVNNSGSITATGASNANTSQHSAGSVQMQATHFTQTASGSIDLSAPTQGGQLSLQTSGNVNLQGRVSAQATLERTSEGTATQGGQIAIAAQGDIELNNAALDTHGGHGGSIALRAKADTPPDNPHPLPDAPGQGRLAIMGHSTLSTRGRSAQGGSTTLLGDHIDLQGMSAIDATGASGGGTVLVGGDWQGGNGVYQASTLTVTDSVSLDASATRQGHGGKVVLWSTDVTDFAGQIASRGAGQGGIGGDAEVSGKALLNYTGFANLLGSEGGKAGNLLLDPYNLYITANGSGGYSTSSSGFTATGDDSILSVNTLTNQLSYANVTLSTGTGGWQLGNIGVMADITSYSGNSLTLNASGNVVIAANVTLNGALNLNPTAHFLMGTNLANASGVSINAYGGFTKTGSGISYLTGNITTSNAPISISGDIQLANFAGGTISLASNGGAISLTGGTISRYADDAADYAKYTASALYYGPAVGSVGTDVTLTYYSNSVFLGQYGLTSAQYLVVGGGGGGGNWTVGVYSGGGGGGGGVAFGSLSVSGGALNSVVVGAGGQRLTAGGDSRLGSILVGGGGAGGQINSNNTLSRGGDGRGGAGYTAGGGGGGGGAVGNGNTYASGGTGGVGTQRSGGNGFRTYLGCCGGGGGGASGAGNNQLGGSGITSSITGTSVEYGVGGQVDLAKSTPGAGGKIGTNTNPSEADGVSGLVIVRYSVGNATYTAGSSLALNAGSGSVSMSSSASRLSSLEISMGSASTVSGSITGSGSFTKNGTGILTMTSNGGYSGATYISGGTLVLQNNAPTKSTSGFYGPGGLRVESSSTSFSNDFSTSGWTFGSTLGGLTLGKDGNTRAITVASAISIAGPVAIYGGNLMINAGLSATGTNTITLKGGSSSSISGTGFVNAGNLLLLGGSTITLNSTSNTIGTLAASGIGSLIYVDSDALTIGTLGSTNGVSATGTVSIGTRTGNLTLSRNVSTTLTGSTSAVVLNAGITAAAGTSTGGNIIVSGTPAVTVGSGSRATLYSGSITGSTGLANLSGLTAGTGRFRYNADETTTFSGTWTPLGTGLYAVYREQPTASLSSTTLTMTYGDLLPTISATGLVNGDVSSYTVSGRLNSTSGNIRASAKPYTITTDLIGLGYSSASGTGTLTVNKKTLTLNGTTATSRVYDGTTTATITSVGSLVGRVGSDVVTVSSTGAMFDTKDVAAGKTVTLDGITLGSTDAGNYTIATTATTTANITPKALTVTASNMNKTYDGLAFSGGNNAVYLGFVVGENSSVLSGSLIYGGNSQGAIDAGAYAITPSGLSSNNYSIEFRDGVLTVDPRQLTVTGLAAQGKVYDGTANATITNWGSVSTGVTVDGLTEHLVLNSGTASFASKNVAYTAGSVTGQTVTATGYSLSDGTASTGFSAGKASNYVLTSASATTTATITPLALSISGVSINDKVYDGTNTATVNGGSISKLGADVVSLVTSAATFASADVAYNAGAVSSQAVTANGFTLTGADAGNYSLNQPTGLTASITPKTVTLNSLSATSKTYDGTVDAPLSSTPTLSGLVSGQTLNVGGIATYASADAGEGILVTVAGLTLADGTGKASNYALSSSTATTTGTINRKILTISGLAAANKPYDGTTNVDITNWGGVTTGVGAETLTLNHGTAAFATADVLRGTDVDRTPLAKTVTATGYSLADGTNGGKASNYTLSSTSATTTAIISPATLTVRANDDAKFVTKSDPTFTVSYSGFVNGETTSIFSAPNSAPVAVRSGAGTVELAGTYAGALTITGGLANNYTISPVAGSFTIVPAGQLLVRVSNVRNDYGSTTTYAVSEAKYLSLSDNTTIVDLTSSKVPSGVNNNTITLTDGSSGTAEFTLGPLSPLLSTAGQLKVGIFQVGATSITETSGNFNDTINVVGAHQVDRKPLTPTVTSSTTKIYDGTTAMTGLTVSSPAILSDDLVSMTTGGGFYASRNAGTHNYTVSNVALAGMTTPTAGDDSANYYISNGTITGSGTISKATLTLNAVTDTKVYDGTTASSKAVVVSGLMSSDSISGLVQVFNSKNVTASTVQASGYTINDGNSGNNYTLVSNTAAGAITPAPLTLTAVSDTKVYDRTTNSNKSVLVSGLVAGDSIGGLSQSFLSKDVAGADLSTLRANSGYTVTDSASADMLGNYAVTSNDATGTITPA